ncbi:MAG: hypothetical protein ACR2JV_00985 [Gaiellales bacterium]
MRRALCLLCLSLLGAAVLAPAAGAEPARGAVFSGTGVWIDIWDALEQQPATVVATAQARGVSVIYVETANAKSKVDVVNPAPLKQLVVAAHAAGIRVVPWYLPGFRKQKVDRRRLAAAAAIGGTEPVDGVAVDIEATYVRNAALRSKRAADLLAWLRATYPTLPIGAITPNPGSNYWPIFPWAEIHDNADAVLPMCYPPRRLSADRMYAMTKDCATLPRTLIGDQAMPVHVISGLAGGLSPAGLDAAARGARDGGANGFSLYDLATTTAAGWAALATWANG